MTKVHQIISDTTLTYHQMMLSLAKLAESEDSASLPRTPEELEALKDGILCDLNEGLVPFRPRYIIPDYAKFMKQGSAFLDLKAPEDLWEACNSLLILYRHVPSITSFPVYLGNLDELLEPFVLELDEKTAKKCLGLFLTNIDRTLTDSFVHADLGPKESVTGRLILELTEEMQLAIPNLTLKYDPEQTSDEFAQLCLKCMLNTAKPSFANHGMFVEEWTENYAIASCYNGLTVGGGGFTLPRMRMYETALKSSSIDDFLDNVLPHYVKLMCQFMDKRVRFIVEESAFFKSNFLVTEGLLELEKFTGMYGMVGLAECVNYLLNIKDPKQGYGNNPEADALGVRIMARLDELVSSHVAPYCDAFDHHYRLHAQVGIDSDGRENSPGARIPIGCEPDMASHILHSTKFHKYFPTGIGDIFKFEETWIKTPEALLDIIKGALAGGMRYFSGYLENNDVVRVTGYLVKKSELAKLDNHQQSLNNCSIFGVGARDTSDALDRRVEAYEGTD